MIFYFTGTGNSLYAAKRLLVEGEKLVNIADAIRKNEYEYDIPQNENVGLVFPVYFYTVPTIIGDFVSRLKLHGAKYVYAVITCGGGICQVGAVLKKMLGRQGIRLDYVTDLLMPDNSMLFYQIPPVSEGQERLQGADVRLSEIKKQIQNNKKIAIGNSVILSNVIGAGYKLCNKTEKFYADPKCISCGLCERICPQEVIKIEEGKPQWTKATCSIRIFYKGFHMVYDCGAIKIGWTYNGINI